MGLDITAYGNLVVAPSDVELDEYAYPKGDNYWKLTDNTVKSTEEEFPGRTAGLTPAIYSVGQTHRFRAGSYGGYNEWRNWLARLAGFKSAKEVWDTNPATGPFIELINFADNEGVIGPLVSAKLAKDFSEYEPEAEQRDAGQLFYLKLYREWRKAFELAANNGAVEFH